MIKFSMKQSPQIWDKPTLFIERFFAGVVDTLVGEFWGPKYVLTKIMI